MSLSGIVGQIVLGWAAADLLTGAFHWWEDRVGNPAWPVLGPWLIVPNRLHHLQPHVFTEHGFWQRNGASIIASVVVGAAIAGIVGPSIFLAALVLGTALSNEVHRFAHAPSEAPGWLRACQKSGFIQSPSGHAAHHRPPHGTAFCVLTDWFNPVIDAIAKRIRSR